MRLHPTIALVIAVAAISFAAIFFRYASPTHPLASAAIRMGVAALLLSPMILRARRRERLPSHVAKAAAIGGVFYALHFGSWVWSLEMTTVSASVTLVTATPLLLAVWSVLTGKDRPDRRLWGALALAAAGILTIGGVDFGSSTQALIGDGLALFGAAAMAGYMLNVRRLGEVDVFAFTGIAAAVASVLLAASTVVAGVSLAPASPQAFGFLVLAALLPQLVGHSALTYSLRSLSPTTVGTATLAEPVGSAVLAFLLLSEVPAPMTAVGCAITLSAVALALRAHSLAERDAHSI